MVWWKVKTKFQPTYDPLVGLPDGAIALTAPQAKALKAFQTYKTAHILFDSTPEGVAAEYRTERWLRSELLIDPHGALTRKGIASLLFFDTPPKPPPHYRHDRYENRSPDFAPIEVEDEVEEEDEEEEQRIRVMVNDEMLTIWVSERASGWHAETLIPNAGKRKKRLEQTASSKERVMHEIIARASAMLAELHVRLLR